MSGELKSYASTAESRVPWLGKVPTHWRVAPAFAAYSPKLIKNAGMAETTVLSLSYGQIVVKPADKLHGLVPESFETYQIIDPGDIIVRTTDLQNDQRSLRVGISRHRGIITSAYMCLRVRSDLSPDFGYLLLNGYDLMKVLYGFGSGLRQNLDFSHIKRMPIPIPPPDEQAAIVRFLDHADREIRKYIAVKRKLIALLNEQKQAIIHRHVTGGLHAGAHLKRTNIPWLPEAPGHWNLIPLKRLLSRIDYGTSEASHPGGSIRILTMGNIQQGEVSIPDSGGLNHVPSALMLEHHDLLFTRTNGNPDLVSRTRSS